MTYWEGEIVDNINYFFLTNKWNASALSDSQHWSKFAAFRESDVQSHYARKNLESERFIFMRWKEKFFLNVRDPDECGMSIAGFYYLCMDRRTRVVEGYYVDQSSTPNQHLILAPHARHFQKSSFAFA